MNFNPKNGFALAGLFALVACSGTDSSTVSGGSGGSNSIGGATAPGGAIVGGARSSLGGSGASGGVNSAGGNSSVGGTAVSTGGQLSSGGASAGGDSSTGGSKSTGGANSYGGNKASGGTTTTGGNSATGGSVTNGGTATTGGSKPTGGASATTGGSKATGGTNATGGSKATGGTSASIGGSRSTGGADSTGGSTNGTFAHPGLLHTMADLNRMHDMVAQGVQPYLDGYNVFRVHAQSSVNYAMQGPFTEFGRNPDVNNPQVQQDANAAYQTALMWVITGDQAYANKSMQILNGWMSTLQTISGSDAILASGIYGFKFVNAAEILRYTNAGWSSSDVAQAASAFRNIFYPVIQDFATFANGNWSLSCVMTMLSIGVFTDDHAMFDKAMSWVYDGTDNGTLTHYIIDDTGQCQESGRDQTHTQLGLGFLAQSAEIAWNQGLDLYGAQNNRLLAGFEYTASYNLGNTVPFVPYTDTTGKYSQTQISTANRGEFRPIYEMVYNHYQHRRAVACPYTQQVAAQLRPEGAAFQADHPGFGTLLFTRPAG